MVGIYSFHASFAVGEKIVGIFGVFHFRDLDHFRLIYVSLGAIRISCVCSNGSTSFFPQLFARFGIDSFFTTIRYIFATGSTRQKRRSSAVSATNFVIGFLLVFLL